MLPVQVTLWFGHGLCWECFAQQSPYAQRLCCQNWQTCFECPPRLGGQAPRPPFPRSQTAVLAVFSLQFVWLGQMGVRHGFDSRNIKERALFCFCFLLVPMKPTLKGGSQPLHTRICSTKRLPLSPSQAGHVPDNGRVAPCRSLSISRAVLSMGAFAFAGYPFGVGLKGNQEETDSILEVPYSVYDIFTPILGSCGCLILI